MAIRTIVLLRDLGALAYLPGRLRRPREAPVATAPAPRAQGSSPSWRSLVPARVPCVCFLLRPQDGVCRLPGVHPATRPDPPSFSCCVVLCLRRLCGCRVVCGGLRWLCAAGCGLCVACCGGVLCFCVALVVFLLLCGCVARAVAVCRGLCCASLCSSFVLLLGLRFR